MSLRIEYLVDIPEPWVIHPIHSLTSLKFPPLYSHQMHLVAMSTESESFGNFDRHVDYRMNFCKSNSTVRSNVFMKNFFEEFARKLSGPKRCPFQKVLTLIFCWFHLKKTYFLFSISIKKPIFKIPRKRPKIFEFGFLTVFYIKKCFFVNFQKTSFF